MTGILIYSEREQLSFELLTAAKHIAEQTGATVKAISINNDELAEALAGRGAEAYQINSGEISPADTGALAFALREAAEKLNTDIILLSSNRRGKELAGRLAQEMNAGCLTDVNGINVNAGQIECVRNALGGATLATQFIKSRNKVIAISPKTFSALEYGAGSVSKLELAVQPSGITLVETRTKEGDTVDIDAANILLTVGQGLEKKEDLLIVDKIAKALGGEVACSKPVATDKKWLSEERIIGLSGKRCQPELAILLGISGQVQFTVGIRDAKVIVAINTDEEANIMQMADYVMVADIHEILPELLNQLQ